MWSANILIGVFILAFLGFVLKAWIDSEKCAVCGNRLTARDRKNDRTAEIEGRQKVVCGYCQGAIRRKNSRDALDELDRREKRKHA